MKILRKLYSYYYRWRYKKYTAVRCEELPEKLRNGKCYYLMDAGFAWGLSFKCPCGCGELVNLNLVGSRPVWNASILDGELNITPSIWRNAGCKSHFWIVGGEIKWVI